MPGLICVYRVTRDYGPFRANTYIAWDLGAGSDGGYCMVGMADPSDASSVFERRTVIDTPWIHRGLYSGALTLLRASPAVHEYSMAQLQGATDYSGVRLNAVA